MPPVDLGLSFPGIGTLPRLKLRPVIARKMLLQAHRWKAEEALTDEVVDVVARPEALLSTALEIATRWRDKGKAGVYGILREELYGEAIRSFRNLSYVHARNTNVGLAKM